MLERYAAADAEVLEAFMARAEASSDDPAEQVIRFVQEFEEASADLFSEPGCLFVSFVYERMPESREAHDVIQANIQLWRQRVGAKLSAAMKQRAVAGDPDSIADYMFTTFEGAFILARATGDPADVGRQIGHYRRYLELLLHAPDSGDPK
jgi:TetR/AcrR family transcriptional repressor of nem operon